jgi:acetoin utilization deacetylase AcuC-like enzyme
MPMKAIYDAGHAAHDPGFFLVRGQPSRSTELPERAARLLSGLSDGGHQLHAPERFGLGPVVAVHTPQYLRFLEEAHALWSKLDGAAAEIVANIHPFRTPSGPAPTYPVGIVGRAGWHMADTACPIGPGTWQAAQLAADVALTAAETVAAGERAAYALTRPPGHHAYADMAGGFCFLNNTAIAAQHLRSRHRRVAILDVDVHHGNGTQGIFWRRGDVLTASLHAEPSSFYPFFAGYASERGEGDGEGANLNLPLPLGTGDDAYIAALASAERTVRLFAPGALVVALGLDASEEDPLGPFKITTRGFERIGAAIARLGLPTVLVQEGGYLSPILGANLAAVLRGFETAA